MEATTDPDRLEGSFDCCVFDRGRFGAVKQLVGTRSPSSEGPFEPCVMLVADREVESLTADHWQVADDVIALPTHREAILARIENLIERRRTSLALAIEREALERQNERLEQFAGVVSHDLRNPLSVAEGYLELARGDGGEAELDALDRGLGRMREIIEDLLTLARGEADASAFQPVELRTFLEECWLAVDTSEATLRVVTDATIRGHPGRLQNLFENLFRNAVEHGGADVTVEVGIVDSGLYVEDDGPGIPAADRESVLESGYSTGEGGTGLGLAIVRQNAEEHGWTVGVTEGGGGGARFEFAGVELEAT